MIVVEQTQPHTSQVGGVPEKERTALQLPQGKYSVIGQEPRSMQLRAVRIFLSPERANQPARFRLRFERALHSSHTV